MGSAERGAGGQIEDLAARLSKALGLEVRDLRRLSGGASRETWAFEAGDLELIVRRDPPGRPSAPGAMGREAAIFRAANAAGLPVPRLVFGGDDPEPLGTAGIVVERVEGETIARRILRDDAYAGARERLAAQCGEFLARLHALPILPELERVDTLASYWTNYARLGQPSPTFELAHRWLEQNRPRTERETVVHGDFRLGNLIVGKGGLRAVLDWELVHIGDPIEDLGWLCARAWRFGGALPVGGFGSYEQLLDAYERAGGGRVDREVLRWWEVLATLKWGIGCMGQANVHLSGAVRSIELAAIGRRVAEQEWDLLDLLTVDRTTPDAPL